MKFKNIRDTILFYLSVPKCVSCKTRLSRFDKALCPACLREYKDVLSRNCSVCAEPLNRCSCSNKYLDAHYIHKLVKVFRYVKRDPMPSNNLIYSLKRDNRRDVLEFLRDELCDAIVHSVDNPSEYVFTNVPRRREAIVRYGIDHAALLAKSVAKKLSAEYYQPIKSKVKKAQKKMMGVERLKNARFKLKMRAKSLCGKKVIIIDDIVTTGSSMGTVAMLLRALGAKKIVGAAISVAYKDVYTPLNTDDRFLPYKK